MLVIFSKYNNERVFCLNCEKRSTYQLSDSTMALIPTEVDGVWRTLIYDEDEEATLLIEATPNHLVNEACQNYGEKMISRIDGAKLLCDFNSKAPIAVSSVHNLFFFPNESPSSSSCSWFSHSHIRKILDGDYGGTRLLFRNGFELYVPTSKGIMNNQVFKTAQYRYILSEHLRKGQQKQVLENILKVFGVYKDTPFT